jgi:DNA-binding NarL/FixJ family response regulator
MPRILLADDHPIVRKRVREVLESEMGWQVCAEAANGREAVEMTAAQRPEIVVLDLSMPEIGGLEAARQIHQKFPQTAVIMLTGHDAAHLTDTLPAFGVQACVSKTDLDQLIQAIRRISQQSLDSSTSTAAGKTMAAGS